MSPLYIYFFLSGCRQSLLGTTMAWIGAAPTGAYGSASLAIQAMVAMAPGLEAQEYSR